MVTHETNLESGLVNQSGPGADPKGVGSVADRIADDLDGRILSGEFAIGDKLPPERALTDLYGASRGTVREAIRSLEVRGMVTRRVGSGTFVTYQMADAPDDVAETTSPLDLVDVRSTVEPQVVRLAVRNATVRDIAALDEALDGMAASTDKPLRFSEWDEAFHLRLAEAARNPLFVAICQQVNYVRGHANWASIKGKALTPARIESYNLEHRALRDAIASRDAARAVETIDHHLEHARRDLMASTDQANAL